MKNKVVIQATLLFTSSLTIMANATIAPSLKAIATHFSENPDAEFLSKLLVTLPALMIAIGAPFTGWIIDRIGRKKLMIIGLLIYGIAGGIAAVLNSLMLILVSRAFLGLGVAAIMTTSTTLIGDYFTGNERTGFMGKQGAFMALGGVVYILLGGFLSDISWRYPFLIYLASFIALPATIFYFYEPESQTAEKHTDQNMLSEKNYDKLTVRVIYITGFLGMALFYFVPVQLDFYLKQMMHASNTLTSVAISVSTMTGAMVSLSYQKLKKLVPRFQTLFALVFTFMSAGYLILFVASVYYHVIIGMFFTGLGMGIMMPNLNLWLVSIAPESMRGRLISGVTTAVFLGQFISPIVSQSLQKYYSLSGLYGIGAFIMIAIGFAYWIETIVHHKKYNTSRSV